MELDRDTLIQIIVGLGIFFTGIREYLKTRRETVKSASPNPMLTAMSITWDRDMQERMLQLMERHVLATESQTAHMRDVAAAQAILANQKEQSTQDKLDALVVKEQNTQDIIADLMKRLDLLPDPPHKPPQRRGR